MNELLDGAALVLADNVRRIIDASAYRSVRSWSAAHKIRPKNIERILNRQHSPTLETIEQVASAVRLMPWQLLVPNLDVSNPPVVWITEEERALYRKLREQIENLPKINGR